jgi:UDP-3-O-[3-hydroxymyristoyl] glucosamine N-acyltransferase
MGATLAELARLVHGKVRGQTTASIDGANSLDRAGPRDIAFFTSAKYRDQLAATKAAAVILREPDATHFTGNLLIVDNPSLAFARICAYLHPEPTRKAGIDASAVVSAGAAIDASAVVEATAVIGPGTRVAEDVWIGPGCVIGRNVSIGRGTRLMARVVVQEGCLIGRNCLVQPGAVIGGDGFGFARDGERWIKQPQLGRVVVGDDVEIGANSTIDRGTLGDTVIGTGVKLDNLVHIAHNVRIGEHTAVAACVGIAGSTVIGKRCTIAGQAGIIEHLDIADDVHITADSLITSSITQAGVYSSSLKAQPVAEWRRNAARIGQLDEIAKRLRSLEQQIERMPKE